MDRLDWLSRLGLRPGERAVVLHADDLGLCQATLEAYRRIQLDGWLDSASVMTPSPWLPALAEIAALGDHDLGVHLVLNSEWQAYRFAPVSRRPVPSLVDGQGFFWASALQTHAHARLPELRSELEAQIERMRALGLEPSHLDSHMLSLVAPRLLTLYAELGQRHALPISLIRLNAAGLARLCNIPAEAADAADQELRTIERAGLVLFDAWAELPLTQPGDRLQQCQRLLAGLPEGLSLLISHPAVDSPELRALASDWEARVADCTLHLDPRLDDALRAEGIRRLRMRDLQQALRRARQEQARLRPAETALP